MSTHEVDRPYTRTKWTGKREGKKLDGKMWTGKMDGKKWTDKINEKNIGRKNVNGQGGRTKSTER
jgi:hypothetical protein